MVTYLTEQLHRVEAVSVTCFARRTTRKGG